VKAGQKRRKERGLHHGGPAAFGTKYQDGEQFPIPELAPVVQRIFAQYLSGESQLAITRGLTADRVPTSKGGAWHQGTTRMILTRGELYADLGIIDRETAAKADALRAARAKSSGATRGRPPSLHLFRKGYARCGSCGRALVPRTGPRGYSVYRCYGRWQDPQSCDMPIIRRVDLDGAVFDYFRRVALDLDATRAQVAAARDRKLAEVRTLLDQAERAEREASAALARVRRDYTRGDLPVSDWRDFQPELTSERDGARAEVTRLRAQVQEVEDWAEVRDVEAETLRKLDALRRAIGGEIQDASGVAEVRAALQRLFERAVVHVQGDQGRVEMIVRPEAMNVEGEELRPVLRPTALALDHAESLTQADSANALPL
jgi:site-specific DNA recombinase